MRERLQPVATFGAIPEGVDVCHRCDNPPCCNPAHLPPGWLREAAQVVAEYRRGAPDPEALAYRQAVEQGRADRQRARDDAWRADFHARQGAA